MDGHQTFKATFMACFHSPGKFILIGLRDVLNLLCSQCHNWSNLLGFLASNCALNAGPAYDFLLAGFIVKLKSQNNYLIKKHLYLNRKREIS